MLKVFLVEDEFVMREGIKNNIDWASHGYEFCGEAGDGEVAYPMIQKCKPDIVITDIRMPFMDGLELSKLIKKEMPWIEIIILTGFEEFAYAKEAIKLGVAQYLSKPISGDELLQELDQLAEKIREKKREQEVREQYQREMEENVQKNRKDFFKYLVTGSKTPVELLEMADHLELDISAIWYNIVLVQIKSTSNQPACHTASGLFDFFHCKNTPSNTTSYYLRIATISQHPYQKKTKNRDDAGYAFISTFLMSFLKKKEVIYLNFVLFSYVT